MTAAETHRSLDARSHEGVGLAIGVSLAVHAVLVAGVVAASVLEPPKLDVNRKPITATLARLGEKRDERWLPRKEVTPPAADRAPPTPAPTKPSPPKPTRAASIFDKITKSPGSIFDRVDRAPAAKVYDKLDKLEGSPDGDPLGTAAQAEGERYYALMKARIQHNFRVGGVPERDLDHLQAVIDMRLGPKGEIAHVEVSASSGNPVYDAEVISAAKRAAPFGPPPEHLRQEVKDGVSLLFRFR